MGNSTVTERTLVLVKPDGVQRLLVGRILARYEERGLKIVGLKLVRVDRDLAERHYAVHRDKPFFAGLVAFITSSPLVAMVLEGPNAIALVRSMVGATRPHDRDRVRSLERDRDERARRDEVDEAREERLLAVDGVVPLGQLAVDLHELEADDLEAALLEAGEDPARQESLDAVGLDQDEGSFVHGAPCVMSGGGAGGSLQAEATRHRPGAPGRSSAAAAEA